ncbi:MAG: archaeosortase/exosortase family protein [Campylobacterales bacterium]|nr:archaeosortase/exosortase family protein [Campylobacterales bacterium]
MKRFVLLYILYMVIAFVLIDYKPLHDLLRLDAYYTAAVVELSRHLIELIGIDVRAEGAFLHLPKAIMEVKFGCNGLEAILLYAAAVLAYPASWKARLSGIVIGSLFLQFFNLLRIALLAWVLEFHPSVFPIMHEYITQSIMIAIAFVVFLVYLQNVSRHARTQKHT